MKSKNSVFIIEDDLLSTEYLKELLQNDGYDVVGIVDNGEDVIEMCKKIEPDIFLIDIMLNGQLSGCETALQIRYHYPKCKIIFLTAYADSEMIDYALNSKAYAYLMKPYKGKEILATIKMALMQDLQHTTAINTDKIQLKNEFYFNTKNRYLYKKNKQIPLSSKKLKLIELLAKNKNITISNEQICMYVWGEKKSNSTLRSLIYRSRSIIGKDIIHNVNGAGYSIA